MASDSESETKEIATGQGARTIMTIRLSPPPGLRRLRWVKEEVVARPGRALMPSKPGVSRLMAHAFIAKGQKKGGRGKGGARERSATPRWGQKGAGTAWEEGKGKGGQGKGRPSSPWRPKVVAKVPREVNRAREGFPARTSRRERASLATSVRSGTVVRPTLQCKMVRKVMPTMSPTQTARARAPGGTGGQMRRRLVKKASTVGAMRRPQRSTGHCGMDRCRRGAI